MRNWPLPFKLRLAGAAAVLVVVVVVLLATSGGGGQERAAVPVTTEHWQAGQEVRGWVPLEVPKETAGLAALPGELAGGRVAAFDLPPGTIVTAEMLREPGAKLVDDTATTVWVVADTGRWHGGPTPGELAVFAAEPAGCAALELEVVDVESGQVAVVADPDLFTQLIAGEPWTVWASPVAGWGERCPADTAQDSDNDAAGDADATGDSSSGGTQEDPDHTHGPGAAGDTEDTDATSDSGAAEDSGSG